MKSQSDMAASWSHGLALAQAPPVTRLAYGDDKNSDDDDDTKC